MPNSSAPRYVLLAALEFDDTGERALREACRIAQRHTPTELHLVHAIAPSLATERHGESTDVGVQLARAPGKLREYVDRCCAGTTLKVTAHVRSGSPAQVVLHTAADLEADLIVLGTHQRNGLERMMLGSVAELVLREARCPVLIAVPKAYDSRASLEPPCPDCLATRNQNADPDAWCERHSRGRLRPHVYTPSDRPPRSMLGT
jgi:nucleotide-binding universal stress UspA family protein